MNNRRKQHWLVRWHFNRFLHILGRYNVIWKTNLCHYVKTVSTSRRMRIPEYGLVSYEEETIYLNPGLKVHTTKLMLIKTVVHECLHVLYGEDSCETRGFICHMQIYALENIANELTNAQCEKLIRMLPHHNNLTKICAK